MKLSYTLAALLGANAIESGDGDQSYSPVWVADTTPFYSTKPTACANNADCGNGMVCIQHMWEYNKQHESMQGCFPWVFCANNSNGNKAYTMFDGRNIQFFCGTEA